MIQYIEESCFLFVKDYLEVLISLGVECHWLLLIQEQARSTRDRPRKQKSEKH